jgi:hypothetical protein
MSVVMPSQFLCAIRRGAADGAGVKVESAVSTEGSLGQIERTQMNAVTYDLERHRRAHPICLVRPLRGGSRL